MKKICFWAVLVAVSVLLSFEEAHAQYNLQGDDPSGLAWKRIKSDHFSVIYPEGTDSLARRYLYLFERNRNLTLSGLRIESPTMPIVIHPFNLNSNGSTAWAPRLLSLYSTPPFEYITPQNWETLLALHEGRHVGQMTHYSKGIYKVLYVLAGEQTNGILNSSTMLPEGDAVMHETDFTNGGRGRSADFLRNYRASFVSDAHAPHEQWRFGSFDKYVPSKYAFGYFLLSGIRYEQGDYFLSADVFRLYVQNWWRIFSGTNTTFKKTTDGLTIRTNWNLLETRLTDYWKADEEMRKPFSPTTDLVEDRRVRYTEYTEPIRLDDNKVAILKEGTAHSKVLVFADSSHNQKSVTNFSALTSSIVKDSKGVLVFSEVVNDHRWGMRSFSILREYDTSRKRFRDITSRTRFFNPALSEDEKSLYAVEYKVEGGSCVVKVDRTDGKVLERIEVPGGGQLSEVAQLGGDIYATVITDEGIGIYRCSSGEWECIARPQNVSIRHMRTFGEEELYFSADHDASGNVYSFNVRTREFTRLTSSRFGAAYPTIDAATGTLYYSDYDKDGYRPVSVSLDSLNPVKVNYDEPKPYHMQDVLASQAESSVRKPSAEEDSALYSKVQDFESRPYRKFSNLLHVHSWFPCYPRMDKIKNLNLSEILYLVDPGVTIISQNLLGTAVTQAGYSYSIKDKLHAGHLNFTYTGWYPALEFQADLNDHHHTRVTEDDGKYRIDTLQNPAFDLYARVYLPLDFSKSGWNVGLVPSLQYNFSTDQYVTGGVSHFKHDVTMSLSYYRLLSKPTAKLTPRWGFGVTASMRGVTSPSGNLESMFYFNAYGYLPGFTKEQGIKLSLSCQKQDSHFYYGSFSNLASVPRGYDKHRILTDYAKATFDYAIPIYAIEGLRGWLGYAKRMQFIPFLDVALDNSVKIENGMLVHAGIEKMMSYGFDWLLDGILFRMGMNLSVGFRYAHTISGVNYMGFLFNTKL